jgi:hypothetical protein
MTDIDLETLLLAIRFGHCSAVHAATLREAGGTWALDALRANEMLLGEIKRLRAIEAAAREVAANVEDDSDSLLGCVVVQPSREEWSAFKAALAAKDTP